MLTVIESSEFAASAKTVWTTDEREAFIVWIASNPMTGDFIPGAGPLRKVRWAREGMGKRSGARVIFFSRLSGGEIVLLLVYAKAKFDNLSPSFLLKLKGKFNETNRSDR